MEALLAGRQVVVWAMAPSSVVEATSVAKPGTCEERWEVHQPQVQGCPNILSCLKSPSTCSPASHGWPHRGMGSGSGPTVAATTGPWLAPSVGDHQVRASWSDLMD